MGDEHVPLKRWRRAMRLAAAVVLTSQVSGWHAAEAAPRVMWRIDEPARGIPASDAAAVYFLTHAHEIVAVERASGRVRWRVPTDSTGDTFGSRVVVHGDIVMAGDYDLVGVERASGRRRWTSASSAPGGAAMHLGAAEGGVAFAGSVAGTLRAIEIASGRVLWATRVGEPSVTTVYAPVLAGTIVAATFSTFDDRPLGGLVVVDAATGRQKWRQVVAGSIGASGRPAVAGGTVMAASRDGTIHVFDADTGVPLWTWPAVPGLIGEQDYRPLAAQGRVVVAGSLSGEIVAHDVVSRRILWRQSPTLASVAFDLAVQDGVAYVPFYSGHLVALRVRDGTELWRLGSGTDRYTWVPRVDGADVLASGSRTFAMFRRSVAIPRREAR